MLKEYSKVVKYSGIRVDPRILLTLGVIIVLGGVAVTFLLRDFLYLVIALVIADVVVMYPYYIGKKRISEIEENLSEALRQIASVLRSGGTFEVAVREIAVSDYGELSREFARMLREMEGGKSFVAALQTMAARVESDFLRKAAVIIADSVRTGGRVADVLDEIAEDVRKFYQIKKERRTRTTMQFLFLAVSAAVLGPFLLGVSIGIVNFMIGIGERLVEAGTLTPQELAAREAAVSSLELIITVFVIVESILAGFMGALIREGRLAYGAVLAPVFLLLAYLSFLGGKFVVGVIT